MQPHFFPHDFDLSTVLFRLLDGILFSILAPPHFSGLHLKSNMFLFHALVVRIDVIGWLLAFITFLNQVFERYLMATEDGPVSCAARVWRLDYELRAEASCEHHSASKSGKALMSRALSVKVCDVICVRKER